jgi:hypothetical protein
MSNLSEQLKRLDEVGYYRLGCPPGELKEAAQVNQFALFEVPLLGVKGKNNVLDALARAAQFPSWFGGNWDALADLLCDLSWQPAPGYVMVLQGARPNFGLSANDNEILQDILVDTVQYWKQRNKVFWIFYAP